MNIFKYLERIVICLQNRGHTKNFEVHYYEVDKDQRCTPVALLNYLEETATSHSHAAGYSIDKLKSDNMGWILLRWSVEIDKLPMLNDIITVETWGSGFKHFYAIREYEVRDAKGNNIIKATSLWILFDIERRRPLRIPQNLADAYGVIPIRAVDDPFDKLNGCTNPVTNINFPIKRSDIDTNKHVNNARYIEWIMETVPDDIYNGSIPKKIKIHYKKEASGKTVTAFADKPQLKDDGTYQVVHEIKGTDGTVFCVAHTTWSKT